MTTMQPYAAWYFFTADLVDEVNDEVRNIRMGPEPKVIPESALPVKVVAAEVDRGMEFAWVVLAGQLQRLESWKVRAVSDL